MAPPATVDGVPAPLAHIFLLLVSVLPLFAPVPTNANIVITAAATVLCGCLRSVKDAPPQEAMTKKDAMRFPFVGSAMLLSLFMAYKFLPADLLNKVVSAYFVAIGTLGLVATVGPIFAPFLPASMSKEDKKVHIPRVPFLVPEGNDIEFSILDALLIFPAAGFCTWYWQTKHWLANNGLGIAFSLQGIEHLSLGAVSNGVILLSMLFFYDVFWVFCTPVMVTVAKKFDAPIKLLFPRVPAATAAAAPQFSMLGLGDIVIPGIFVAIVLRYDMKHGNRMRYFWSAFGGYVTGLVATIFVMHTFQAAQPALLYIVPAVLLSTFAHAAAAGEASVLYHYDETEGDEDDADDKSKASKKTKQSKKSDAPPSTPPPAAAAAGDDDEATERRITRSAIKAAKKDS